MAEFTPNERDRETWQAICDLTVELGWSPSYREIAERIDRNLSTTARRLDRLMEWGVIQFGSQPGGSRQLRVVGATITMPKEPQT